MLKGERQKEKKKKKKDRKRGRKEKKKNEISEENPSQNIDEEITSHDSSKISWFRFIENFPAAQFYQFPLNFERLPRVVRSIFGSHPHFFSHRFFWCNYFCFVSRADTSILTATTSLTNASARLVLLSPSERFDGMLKRHFVGRRSNLLHF